MSRRRLSTAAVGSLATVAGAAPAALAAGTDEQAAGLVRVLDPGYRPWANLLFAAPDTGTESLLFALQAAAGLAALGYCLAAWRKRARAGRGKMPDAD